MPDMRGRHHNGPKSSGHHKWNRGKLHDSTGYTLIRVGRTHRLADPNGYCREHLLVWVAAGFERPARGWLIHHRNGNRDDNRIENLVLMSRVEHNRTHNLEKARDRDGKFGKKHAGRVLDGRTWEEMP